MNRRPVPSVSSSPGAAGKTGGDCLTCALRRQPAFKPKPEEQIAFIREMKVFHRHLAAGSEIIHQGEVDAELFTLFSGWAFRHRTLPDGRRQILNFLLPGDLLGLQANMMAAAEYGIEALTDVELCQFPRNGTSRLLQDMPELAFDLLWLGSREERLVDANLTSVGQHTARERVATLILSLYRRCAHLDLVKDNTFQFPLTRVHIADSLGLSLVHTTKTWTYLRRMGLFTVEGGMLKLLDPRLTSRWAQTFDEDWVQRPLL